MYFSSLKLTRYSGTALPLCQGVSHGIVLCMLADEYIWLSEFNVTGGDYICPVGIGRQGSISVATCPMPVVLPSLKCVRQLPGSLFSKAVTHGDGALPRWAAECAQRSQLAHSETMQ